MLKIECIFLGIVMIMSYTIGLYYRNIYIFLLHIYLYKIWMYESVNFKYFLKIKLIKYLGNTQTFWRHKFHYKVCIFERPIDIAKDILKEKNNRDSNKEVSLI